MADPLHFAALARRRAAWLDACAAVWDARQALQRAQLCAPDEVPGLDLAVGRARGRAAVLRQELEALQDEGPDPTPLGTATARWW
jgi:hypothetical protein